MTAPTDDELAAWAALCEGATPGPWECVQTEFACYVSRPSRPGLWCDDSEDGSYGYFVNMEPADAAFIAAAREAMPRLIAAYREAQADARRAMDRR